MQTLIITGKQLFEIDIVKHTSFDFDPLTITQSKQLKKGLNPSANKVSLSEQPLIYSHS